MALDGLNGFGFVYENAGYTSPYASTGFTAPEGYKTPVDELQTELTGKKKASKPKKTSTSKKSSVPRPKVNYNGTVTYGSLTFKNVEEFKRAFPEVKVPQTMASRVKTPPITTPVPQMSYIFPNANGDIYGKMLKLHQLEMELKRLESGSLPIIEQPIEQPLVSTNSKPLYQEIKDGPFKGKTGKYVNGELVGIRDQFVNKNGMMCLEDISLEEAQRRFQISGSTPQPTPQPLSNSHKPYAKPNTTIGQVSEEVKATLKSEVNAGSKSFLKLGKGKLALLGALAVGATILGISQCSDDEKPLKDFNQEGSSTSSTGTQPSAPAQQAEPSQQTETASQPVTQTTEETPTQTEQQVEVSEEQPQVVEEPQYNVFQALKGSDYWKYAEWELRVEHQSDPNYQPSDAEINTRMFEIMQRNNVVMAIDGIHSEPLLKVGDDVELNKNLTDLLNEAKSKIKEEKGQDYEPGYTETARKMQEILTSR